MSCGSSVFALDDDLYFGVVYVSPSESRFNTAVEIALFAAEIACMCIDHKYLVLMGDFNAGLYRNRRIP